MVETADASFNQLNFQLGIALLSALASACYFLCMSRAMKGLPGISSSFTLAYSHLLACPATFIAILFTDVSPFAIAPNQIQWLGVCAAFLVASRLLYFFAYARIEMGSVAVFSALTPIYAMVVSFYFLDETLTTTQVIGILIVCISLYLYFLPARAAESNAPRWLWPFKNIFSSTPVLCAFLSTIPTAFASSIQRHLMESQLNVLVFSFWLLATIGVTVLLLTTLMGKTKEPIFNQIFQFNWQFYVASIFLLPLMHSLFGWVILHQPTAVALVLQRSSIVFQIVLAFIFLNERRDLVKRLQCVALMFVGFWFIVKK
jgi:drug/metabolite transporter (DMT)-like permease